MYVPWLISISCSILLNLHIKNDKYKITRLIKLFLLYFLLNEYPSTKLWRKLYLNIKGELNLSAENKHNHQCEISEHYFIEQSNFNIFIEHKTRPLKSISWYIYSREDVLNYHRIIVWFWLKISSMRLIGLIILCNMSSRNLMSFYCF